MRRRPEFVRRAVAAALLAALLVPALDVPAAQADRLRERAESDSFGNLVVWSRSGYKRIVVGQGRLAEGSGARAGAPDLVDGQLADEAYAEGQYAEGVDAYAESGDAVRREQERRVRGAYAGDCYRAPAFVKGRSYMYGLADGEIPVITPCARFGD